MYAIIRCGSHQHRVSKGDRLRVQSLSSEVGSVVEFRDVLWLGPDGDLPASGAVVTARVEGQVLGPKLQILKFRRRKHSRKQMGHRQGYTEISVTGIEPGAA